MIRSFIYLSLFLSLHSMIAKDRDRNASTTPTLTEKAISAGYNHTLIIQEGNVTAFGENLYGQLGDSTYSPSAPGVLVRGLDHIIAVSAGRRHSMALRADGKVFVWGDNTYSQLGSIGAGSAFPIAVLGVSDIIDIQAGDFHCLALKSDGTVISWGINNLGELGQGFTSPFALPGNVVNISGTANLDGVTLISAGARHSLAIQNGQVLAWGDNLNTQLGRSPSSFTFRSRPIKIRKTGGFFPVTMIDVISLSAGETHSSAIDVEGNLWTWGEGVFGQLGVGGPINPLDPSTYRRRDAVNVASKVRTMAAGYNHTMYIDSQGKLHFFGTNFLGQLGIPVTNPTIETPGTSGVDRSVALACGADFTVLLLSDGTIQGAGDNAHEQLGPVAAAPFYEVFTPFFNKVDRIAQLANQSNSYVLKSDGTVWSFGQKDYVGFPSTSDVATPTQITTLFDIIAIGGTNQNAFALKVDGTVHAWGENASGVCGQGTGSSSSYISPVAIASLTDIVYIDGTIQGYTSGDGGSSAGAIDVNGDLYTWGNNRKYTLGDGTTTKRLSPVRASATTKDFSFSMSKGNSFVLNADNTVEVWGNTTTDGSALAGPESTIKPINSTSRFKSISTTRSIRIGLTVDGKIELWGNSGSNSPNFFKICNGSLPYYKMEYPAKAFESPTSFAEISNVKFVETGDPHGFIIKGDGNTMSWGYNKFAQLGLGYKSNEEILPLIVSCTAPGYAVSMYTSVSSEHHALANVATARIESWGPNTKGQVGNGSIATSTSTPVLSCNAAMRIVVNPVLGIDNSELLIYPNPTSEILHIILSPEMIQGANELRLIDASGKTVHSQKEVFKEMSLSLSGYNEGIYILEVGAMKRRILIRK